MVADLATFFGQTRESTDLGDAGRTIEAGADDAIEVLVDGEPVGVRELMGDDGPPEADAGEPRGLGEGGDLYGDLKERCCSCKRDCKSKHDQTGLPL